MQPTFWPLSPQIPLMRTASEPDLPDGMLKERLERRRPLRKTKSAPQLRKTKSSPGGRSRRHRRRRKRRRTRRRKRRRRTRRKRRRRRN